MSEQKVPFMQALDSWIDVNVIAPLVYESEEGDEETGEEKILRVKKAIKGKVLDSYHNGLRAAGGQPRQFSHFARARRGTAPALAVIQR